MPTTNFVVTYRDGSTEQFVAADPDDARAWSKTCHADRVIVSIDPVRPPADDAVADLTEQLLTDFGRTFHEVLGVADAYESDQERLFSVIVEAAKLYCQVGAGEDGTSIASHISCTADALVENLEVVFAEELAR